MNVWLRLSIWGIAVLLVLLPLVAVVNGWIAAQRWPLTRLQVTGELDHVSAQAVRVAVLPELGMGFFATDLRRVRDAAAALPWVASVQVRKRWPDLLQVDVREHRPFARWGEQQWLSHDGVIFSAPDDAALAHLPRLSGTPRRVAEVVALYQFADSGFAALDRHVTELQLSPRGSWSLGLDDGSHVLIGRDDATARLTRLLRAMPQVTASNAAVMVRADLRYTNGIALRFAGNGVDDAKPLQTRDMR
ncbi:MAG: cell division protein FtsQ [Lysobacterales bacterium CG17_big_fil_post_rev_8_21_14_2_50_64_11]|nr:MAG: cell division protein FtsQ [Xanthomonadales bacterium CG17_big_fil_post_rev_8_21_14_2_50_64_11]PIX59887.1 MAG: cell division protein FtsQ [Xanthomonadales bacterium CG_4_10_14_3_um_filter_64_11]